MSQHRADPSNPFLRTDEERQRAYELLLSYGGGEPFEISVCADCGYWSKWDGDLINPGGLRCFDGGPHLVTRVCIQPLPPPKRD